MTRRAAFQFGRRGMLGLLAVCAVLLAGSAAFGKWNVLVALAATAFTLALLPALWFAAAVIWQGPPASFTLRPQFSIRTLLIGTMIVGGVCAVGSDVVAPWLRIVLVLVLAAGFTLGGLWILRGRPARILGFLFVEFSVLAVGMLLPPVTSSRTPGLRMVCSNNIREFSMALLTYEATHGNFPPAYLSDESGKPMHSWRTMLLKYLDRPDLYQACDFQQPWDAPKNAVVNAAPTVMYMFVCPSDGSPMPPQNYTNYVVVTGPGTIFPDGKTTKFSDIKNPAKTILLVETVGANIRWTEPRDLPLAEALKGINPPGGGGIRSHHPGGANVVFADGHLEFLPDTTTPAELKAMLLIDGGQGP
jgi:prepilin-type processing-associated H-X9-DG protein